MGERLEVPWNSIWFFWKNICESSFFIFFHCVLQGFQCGHWLGMFAQTYPIFLLQEYILHRHLVVSSDICHSLNITQECQFTQFKISWEGPHILDSACLKLHIHKELLKACVGFTDPIIQASMDQNILDIATLFMTHCTPNVVSHPPTPPTSIQHSKTGGSWKLGGYTLAHTHTLYIYDI